MESSYCYELRARRTPVVEKAVELLARRLKERCDVAATETQAGEGELVLDTRAGLAAEGFRLSDGPDGRIHIEGADGRGLLYGIGKFLRSSRFEEGRFSPGSWRGTSAPENPARGIYFASHFHNFYHEAPPAEVARYVEELALWGLNALMVWFDMHHFNGISDPAAQEMIERLRLILRAGKAAGMNVGLCLLANEAYANSPQELRADPETGRAHYGVELCPSKPGAEELMLRWFDEEFEAFEDIGLDHIWIWPYDQGGCACERCSPWGANGFPRMARQVADLYHRRFPDGKVILSTWLFDMHEDQGEWRGLSEAFAQPPGWLDYVLIDGHEQVPRYPLEHGVPGGLPGLNFPEISMWEMWPWGGYGANPQPRRLQSLWEVSRRILAGGFPYSEGIYEDINKVVCSRFYWDPEAKAADAVREYAAYEYSPDVADEVVRAVRILEQNHTRRPITQGQGRFELREGADGAEHVAFRIPEQDAGSEECYELLESAGQRLSGPARSAWRWRVLLLRGLIDRELFRSGGVATPACEEAFKELEQIYNARNAEPQVMPPGVEAVRSRRDAN